MKKTESGRAGSPESMKPFRKAIFIDRDGVINVDPIGDYVKSWKDFRFEEGSLEALKRLTDLGYEIVIISNQAGIGDKVYPLENLWEIDRNMLEEFNRLGIRVLSTHYCLHGKNEGCACRKPKTGLFETATKDFAFDPRATYFVGDKASDMEAGRKFGLKTIFVRTGHGRNEEKKLTDALKPDLIADNLLEAVRLVSG